VGGVSTAHNQPVLFPNIFQNRKDAIGSHFIKQQLELL